MPHERVLSDWRPKGQPDLILMPDITDTIEAYIYAGDLSELINHVEDLPLEFQVQDPNYTGPISLVHAKGLPNSDRTKILLKEYQLYNRLGDPIAMVDIGRDNEVTLLDPSLTPQDIAGVLRSIGETLTGMNFNEAYKAFGLYASCPPEQLMRIPEDQRVVDENGELVQDDVGNYLVILGNFVRKYS